VKGMASSLCLPMITGSAEAPQSNASRIVYTLPS